MVRDEYAEMGDWSMKHTRIDYDALNRRMDKILTFAQLHAEMGKWLEAFPSRGAMKAVFPNNDDMGLHYVGIIGLNETTIESPFFPELDVMVMKGEQ